MDGQSSEPTSIVRQKNHKNLSLDLLRLQQDSSQPSQRSLEGTKPSLADGHYKHGPVQILPSLFLGAFHNALQPDVISCCNISCILNVASEIEPPILMTGIQYHHLRWTHAQDLSREFSHAIRVLESVLSTGAKVLVHCQCGIERSAALVIAYILYLSRRPRNVQVPENPISKSMSLEEAYEFVRDRAPGIRPNMELMYQLGEFEQTLLPHKQPVPNSRRRAGSAAAKSHLLANRFSSTKRPRASSFREVPVRPLCSPRIHVDNTRTEPTAIAPILVMLMTMTLLPLMAWYSQTKDLSPRPNDPTSDQPSTPISPLSLHRLFYKRNLDIHTP
ncbi:Dual specificity protein phosphatase 4 [Apophysomyces ossiformis]|uniref:protein-tyrosine-phosphatase n=1 Tax=Apophysomyces ossiformis TaxID=679940 RepID=A0A8H7BY96_9FUNG|nr:Dual specificity protein phosphatase 4 [Apophysomyces ossiformis]